MISAVTGNQPLSTLGLPRASIDLQRVEKYLDFAMICFPDLIFEKGQ